MRLLSHGWRSVQLMHGYTRSPHLYLSLSLSLLHCFSAWPSACSIPRGLCFIDGLRRFTLVQADSIQFLRSCLVSGVCFEQIDFASYYSDCNLYQTRSLSRWLRIARVYRMSYTSEDYTEIRGLRETRRCHAET